MSAFRTLSSTGRKENFSGRYFLLLVRLFNDASSDSVLVAIPFRYIYFHDFEMHSPSDEFTRKIQ